LRKEDKAKERSLRAVELLGSAIDVKINELTESNRQLKRKIFDLYTIFEISRNFNSVLNYQSLVDSFLLTSLGQVGASSAALYLMPEGDDGELCLAKCKGLPSPKMAQGSIRMDGALAGYLVTMSKPVSISDVTAMFGEDADSKPLSVFARGLVVPLIIKSKLKGILAIGGKMSGVAFGNDDVEFLTILSNQFVIALENARLYESEKQALAELKKAQKQLVITERQAAIGELSAKIAHEVNNPLSIITNYLHLCNRDMGNAEKSKKHLKVVREEIGRIARIVRQLLDFHRPRQIEMLPIRPTDVLEDVLVLVDRQLYEKNIEIHKEYDEPLPLITGSPEQLKQVFLNLILNARDFMPDGGQLHIDVTGNDKKLQLVFRDTGPGIPEDVLPRIFEPFFTTKEDSTGTGLGLSVCYSIIKDHGGQIEARNAPRKGSCFIITLPAQYINEATH